MNDKKTKTIKVIARIVIVVGIFRGVNGYLGCTEGSCSDDAGMNIGIGGMIVFLGFCIFGLGRFISWWNK